MESVFTYMMVVTDLAYPRIRDFLRAEVGQAGEELLKTTYDQILEKGQAEGRAEGRVEGRLAGRSEGMADVLLKLLDTRFESVPRACIDRVRSASGEEIVQWAERVLTAETLDQVFLEE